MEKTIKCPHCNKELDNKQLIQHVQNILAKRGGDALKKSKGADYYKELGRKGAQKRWTKKGQSK